ncbi:zonadhesin-like [Cydia splendana]|uniref:zonadhesin-like n=1 Tax=Cydia splendana TaxID=1100963 RepID=UPI00300D4640
MGTKGAMVGVGSIILLVSAVVAESPPVVDYGKPVPPPCPKNEVRRCQNTCPPDGCITLYAAFDCIANQTCVNGCYCKDDYLRIGRNGPCVPRDQCPPMDCVSDPNARRGCGDKCGKTCADYNSNPICPKRPCKNDGCDCKEGHIHDTNQDKCVLPKDCTKPCKPHERWSPCLMGECVAKTCEDLGKPLTCPANAVYPCPGGCICDYGYVRAKNGTCVDAKTCPCCGGDPNAQTGCGNPCGKTCASLNVNKSDIMCPQYCEVNGCDCKEGYLLDDDAKPPRCVLIKDCPKPPNKCGKNEEYYCGPSCPDSEATCSKPNPPTCINKRCEFKCFCKNGYVRDDKNGNVCIPADKCHIEATCSKPNPPTCINKRCEFKCFCKKGYVRDDKNGNVCIPADKCRNLIL